MTTMVFKGQSVCLLSQLDPSGASELEFQDHAVTALNLAYPQWRAFRFSATFEHERKRYRPDLAVVCCDLSHWFVIEVEMTSHSLEAHVLPQVIAFRFGEIVEDCTPAISTGLGIDRDTAASLVRFVPRSVAVVANKWDARWESSLSVMGIQIVSLSAFWSAKEQCCGYVLDGTLRIGKQSLGFGTYSATDRAIRMPLSTALQEGKLEIEDPLGFSGIWRVQRTESALWLAKERGSIEVPDSRLVQLLRERDGRLWLEEPHAIRPRGSAR